MTSIHPLPTVAMARKLLRQLASYRSMVGPQPIDKPLILYGAGKLGRMAAELFKRLGLPIAYVVDRACGEGDRLLDDVPVIRPEAADQIDRETCLIAVCIVTAPYEPIRDDLAAMGWRHIFPVYDVLDAYRDRLPLNNGWFAGALKDEDINQIDEILAGWSDDWSRAAYLQFLAWRLHRLEWKFDQAPVRTDDRYFIEPVRRVLGRREYFLDAGAHHGEVIQRWLAVVQNQCEGVMAVEADRDNVAHLTRWAAALPRAIRERISIRACALAEERGDKRFNHGWGLSSRIDPRTAESVHALRLDDLDFPLTFGKIHLEGGELDALRGGTETLRRYRPILAITTYHNADGLWRILRFLMETLPDYRYFMRLHGWCGTGSVVYAVPNEKGGAT
ncbi:MAG: FkbM family methyltransferase [Nitrospira sp.]|nr:FkbM family methyltransferase [Nitrospira sp.]MCP9462294.1 FkbM family methyltransferase [Nitrospira sp.]MCP9474877.1 FkbM family methyltransferase [Nitrospira sp.]